MLGCIEWNIFSRDMEALVSVNEALVGFHLEYCVQFWSHVQKDKFKKGAGKEKGY